MEVGGMTFTVIGGRFGLTGKMCLQQLSMRGSMTREV